MNNLNESQQINDKLSLINMIQLVSMNHSEIQRWIVDNYPNKSNSSRYKLYQVKFVINVKWFLLINNFNQ